MTLNFRGSIVSFYHSRQATGLYKCCTDVYSPPTRGYNFDVEFLTPEPAAAAHADVPRRQHDRVRADHPTEVGRIGN